MKDAIVITIPSHPKFLSVVRSVTAAAGRLYEFDDKTAEEIKLAVDEACTNIMKHAYRGDTKQKIVLEYSATQKAFKVVIEDSGVKARLTSIKGRSFDDIRPGGLGVHFIRRVFDVYRFDAKKKKGNRLTLIKYFEGKK
jgi:serine/threonine-protein kinase RsbW